MRSAALSKGMILLKEDGLKKAVEGMTSRRGHKGYRVNYYFYKAVNVDGSLIDGIVEAENQAPYMKT